jgi:anti-sigma factor RsiW
MRCDRVRTLLSPYVDGELPAAQSARVADHLAACDACTAEARSLTRLIAILHALPAEEPPPTLHGAILMALDRTRSRRRRAYVSLVGLVHQ